MIRAVLKFAFVMWKDVDGLIISVPPLSGRKCANCQIDDVCSAQNVGSGWGHVFIPGLKMNSSPCIVRHGVDTRNDTVILDWVEACRANLRTIDNQLMVWSPKGFLTGSQTTPNTVMFSWGFERADMNCGAGCDASPGAGNFHSQTLIESGNGTVVLDSTELGCWHVASLLDLGQYAY